MATLSDYNFSKKNDRKIFKIFWCFTYLALTVTNIVLIVTLWHQFEENPIVTTLESSYLAVNKIPFPGIGICNMNKISKRRATAFAKELAAKTGKSFERILNATQLLGKLHDFDYDVDDIPDIEYLQTIIDSLDLNIIKIIKSLTIPCEEFLTDCMWRQTPVECSAIFRLRRTFEGYCCTFNYVTKTEATNVSRTKPLSGVAGRSKGLSVTIQNDLEDDYYVPMFSQGVTVQIFTPTDYPDLFSGSHSLFIARVGTENFLKLKPTTIMSVKDVIKYPLTQRQCLFDEERATKFENSYSQSDCNVDCRVTSTLALCECIPFMIPISTKETVCGLNDLNCLHRYKNKWNFLHPNEETSGLLEREEHDSLHCQRYCYPSCDGTSYRIFPSFSHLNKGSNSTIVHLFYSKRFSDLYKQDVVYYWFEILSNFGGTFSLVIGLSIVSITEFVVYIMQTTAASVIKQYKT